MRFAFVIVLLGSAVSSDLPPSPPDAVYWTSQWRSGGGIIERRLRPDGSTYELNTGTGAVTNLSRPCSPRPFCGLPDRTPYLFDIVFAPGYNQPADGCRNRALVSGP